MTTAAEARHHSLLRFEQAAGQAFGYADEVGAEPKSLSLVTPTTIAWATVATAFAATMTYFV